MASNSANNHFPWSHVVGFALSIILTLVALWVGLYTDLSYTVIVTVIFILAFIQAAIQLFMFMHMTEGKAWLWQSSNMLFAAFTAIVIVAGTVWVMTEMH
ncbi:cytochrome aa3 quinol oxidase subunit IV [Metabacillus idriensis]|uniref:cytochrome aa3 quinol oxidase subunit IV n=1 Tax=Metabacillus idriensis TaxID=324768 RepID=UPI00174BD15A|nr:cytochrome aa3 quinol oxidase subunit IV [Metabacillus idriensis]